MNPVTTGWIVFRIRRAKVEFLGLYKDKAWAEATVEVLPAAQHWQVALVPFLGWGQVSPGFFGENGSSALRMIATDMIWPIDCPRQTCGPCHGFFGNPFLDDPDQRFFRNPLIFDAGNLGFGLFHTAVILDQHGSGRKK